MQAGFPIRGRGLLPAATGYVPMEETLALRSRRDPPTYINFASPVPPYDQEWDQSGYDHRHHSRERPRGSPDDQDWDWNMRRNRMPQLEHRMDDTLRNYLEERGISLLFVHEIDLFLYTHPELEQLQPEWCAKLLRLPVLDAYRSFVKGYTKPARYVDGILPMFTWNTCLSPIPLMVDAYDTELIDFFDGWEYRYDILDMVDRRVAYLVKKHDNGGSVSDKEYKLLSYVIHGNPVDAFKYFEYQLQDEWLPHRYLPEHIILNELPKEPNYSQPMPFFPDQPREGQKQVVTYPEIRARMARAYDEGVDVLQVLMKELVSYLARRRFRRLRIENLCREVEQIIRHEREICGKDDLVDLVMDFARSHFDSGPTHRISAERKRVFGHKILEMKESLKDIYADIMAGTEGDLVNTRYKAERELVHEVVKQATREHTMTNRQAFELLSMVPTGRRSREKRGRPRGAPKILQLLAKWL